MRFATTVGVALGLVAILSATAQTQNPVGVWDMQADAQGQVSQFTLTIAKEGDVLKGKIASETYGNQDLTDLKFEDGTLTYTRKLDLGGQAVEMAFKGKVEGDRITGAYSLQGVDLPVTGTRKNTASGK